MFGNVWDWAREFRTTELSIGIKAYQIPTALKDLVDDVNYWDKHKVYDMYEISARLHHRAELIVIFIIVN